MNNKKYLDIFLIGLSNRLSDKMKNEYDINRPMATTASSSFWLNTPLIFLQFLGFDKNNVQIISIAYVSRRTIFYIFKLEQTMLLNETVVSQ